MKGDAVKDQIQWILSYIQGWLVNVWKENILEDLEVEVLEYKLVGKFSANLWKEFGGEDEEVVKVAELRWLEQERKTMEEFIQEFRRAVRGSEYKRWPLVEKFKKNMNRSI